MKTIYTKRILAVAIFAFVYLNASATNHILNQASGSISIIGTDYTNNMDESWEISTGENKMVSITYTIDIEDGYDYVDIYSMDANGVLSNNPVATLTGSQSGQIVTNLPTGRAKIFFSSDVSVSNDNGYTGIELSFKSDNSMSFSDNVYINGKLGVGTSSPQERLHVNGAIRGNSLGGALRVESEYGYIDLGPQNSSFAHIYTNMPELAIDKPIDLISGCLTSYKNTNLSLQTGRGTTRMTILNSNGNVGIGTVDPQYKLDVAGNARVTNTLYVSGAGADIGGALSIQNSAKTTPGQASTWTIYNMSGSYGNSLQFWAYDNLGCVEGGMCAPRLTLLDNGNVGIGTTIPDALLTVNGTIHAKEVNIQLTGPLADFVFKPAYNLMSLPKLEQFVKTNSHLPGIPSASEVDQNGISVGEMQNKLLQKIEELTLYVIDQQKQIEELKQQLKK